MENPEGEAALLNVFLKRKYIDSSTLFSSAQPPGALRLPIHNASGLPVRLAADFSFEAISCTSLVSLMMGSDCRPASRQEGQSAYYQMRTCDCSAKWTFVAPHHVLEGLSLRNIRKHRVCFDLAMWVFCSFRPRIEDLLSLCL